MNQSKRLIFSIVIIAINFMFGIYGIYFKTDLSDLGSFLAMVNAPLYVYVFGESYRPSKKHYNENRN